MHYAKINVANSDVCGARECCLVIKIIILHFSSNFLQKYPNSSTWSNNQSKKMSKSQFTALICILINIFVKKIFLQSDPIMSQNKKLLICQNLQLLFIHRTGNESSSRVCCNMAYNILCGVFCCILHILANLIYTLYTKTLKVVC